MFKFLSENGVKHIVARINHLKQMGKEVLWLDELLLHLFDSVEELTGTTLSSFT